MKKYLITYVDNKFTIKHALVEAISDIEAYLTFMLIYPRDYGVIGLERTSGDNLPADVEYPQRKTVTHTVC